MAPIIISYAALLQAFLFFRRYSQVGKAEDCKSFILGSNPSAPIQAGVAQLVEQLICNQQVGGSSPFTSLSRYSQVGKAGDCKSSILGSNPSSDSGGMAEWLKAASC